jgi:putative membrane protein
MRLKWRIVILVILYLVGILGIALFNQTWLLALTPINLVLSTLLILPNKTSLNFWLLLTVIFLLGIAVEIVGVTTGYPFGEYYYGKNLGPKLIEVPLVIGLNWWLLTYISWTLVYPIIKNRWFRVFTSAGLMLGLDILIEHVAPQVDFWYWKADIIPLENYISWYLVGVLFSLLLDIFLPYNRNRMNHALYLTMLIFFVVLNIKTNYP